MGGAVGRPFAGGEVFWGMEGGGWGVVRLGGGEREVEVEVFGKTTERRSDVVLTGDSSNSLLASARREAEGLGLRPQVKGAAGAKFLAVARGEAALAIMHFGTSKWDTCAHAAILAAAGGKITDLFGAPLPHWGEGRGLKNARGVVASSAAHAADHDELCRRMRASPLALGLLMEGSAGEGQRTGPEAVDVALDLDGELLDKEFLESVVSGGGSTLERYEAPESGAFRGMMSTGARLLLKWADAGSPLPATVFYKRVAMAELEVRELGARSKSFAKKIPF